MEIKEARVRRLGKTFLPWVEDLGLIFILGVTLLAGGQAVWAMLMHGTVELSDLLLLFIYLELITMVRMYFTSRKLPVRMPLYIAMVAIARHIVVDANHSKYEGILMISIAVLILSLAVLVVRFGHLRFPYPPSEDSDHGGTAEKTN